MVEIVKLGLSSSRNFQAAFSAKVLDPRYAVEASPRASSHVTGFQSSSE